MEFFYHVCIEETWYNKKNFVIFNECKKIITEKDILHHINGIWKKTTNVLILFYFYVCTIVVVNVVIVDDADVVVVNVVIVDDADIVVVIVDSDIFVFDDDLIQVSFYSNIPLDLCILCSS